MLTIRTKELEQRLEDDQETQSFEVKCPIPWDHKSLAKAVIAGSSLEVHIRALCVKHGVVTHVAGKPKKADTMNADLKKESVYGGLEQKQVTSWLALRNSAAHGKYSDYVASDARGLIDGIQTFAVKYPA